MATTFNISSNYSGKDAQKYIHASVLKAFTLDNGGVEVLTNVGYQTNVTQLAVPDDLLADASCGYDPQHSVTSTERILQPKFLQVNLDLCKDQWIQTYQNVGEKSANLDFKADFQNHLMGYIGEKVAAQVENNIWKGNAAGSGANSKFDGFKTLFDAASSGVVDATINGATIGDDKNFTDLTLDEFERAYAGLIDGINDEVYTHSDVMTYAPINFIRAYLRYLGQDGNGYEDRKSMWSMGLNQQYTIEGIPIFVAAGIASNEAYIAQKSNLWFGTQDSSDQTQVRFIDTADTLGDQNVRVVLRTAAGTQFGIGADITKLALPTS